MWPVPGSHLYPICLPTSGHNHQACAKPVTGSHFRSTNRLPVEPSGSTAGHQAGYKPAPSGLTVGLEARQRQAGTCVSVNDGVSTDRIASRINPRSGLRGKICGDRPLVSSNAGSMAWPGLVRGSSRYGLSDTWPVELRSMACWCVACLIPGLSGTRPVQLRTESRLRRRQRRRGPVATRAPAASGAASIRCRWCRRYGLRVSRLCGCVAGIRAGRDAPVPAVLRLQPVAAGRRMTGKQSGTS